MRRSGSLEHDECASARGSRAARRPPPSSETAIPLGTGVAEGRLHRAGAADSPRLHELVVLPYTQARLATFSVRTSSRSSAGPAARSVGGSSGFCDAEATRHSVPWRLLGEELGGNVADDLVPDAAAQLPGIGHLADDCALELDPRRRPERPRGARGRRRRPCAPGSPRSRSPRAPFPLRAAGRGRGGRRPSRLATPSRRGKTPAEPRRSPEGR